MVFEGGGLESTSWFWDLGLSLQLCFFGVVVLSPNLFFFLAGGGGGGGGGGGALTSHLYILGVGEFFFKFCFVWMVVVVLL